MFVLLAWVNESFVSHEQVTARKRLATEVADERLLLRMRADVALEMFLPRS